MTRVIIMEVVTVIIPAYNVEKYIGQCLDSVLNQSYDNLEVVIINDASTDSTLEIIQDYINRDNRISLINYTTNKGNGFGRNDAIVKSTGEYILFVDSDDTIEKNTVETLLSQAKADNSDVVLYGHRQIAMKHRKVQSCIEFIPDQNLTDLEKDDLYVRFLLQKSGLFIQPWKYFVKRSLLIDCKIGFDESGIYYEDIIYSSKLLYHIDKLSVVGLPLYNYFTRKGSITKTWTRKTIESRFSAIISVREFLKQAKVFNQYKNAYAVFFISTGFVQSYADYIRMEKEDREVKNFLYQISCSDFIRHFDISRTGIPDSLLKARSKYDIDYYKISRLALYLSRNFGFAVSYGKFLQKIFRISRRF